MDTDSAIRDRHVQCMAQLPFNTVQCQQHRPLFETFRVTHSRSAQRATWKRPYHSKGSGCMYACGVVLRTILRWWFSDKPFKGSGLTNCNRNASVGKHSVSLCCQKSCFITLVTEESSSLWWIDRNRISICGLRKCDVRGTTTVKKSSLPNHLYITFWLGQH